MVDQTDLKEDLEEGSTNLTTGEHESKKFKGHPLLEPRPFEKEILGVWVYSQGAADFAQAAIDAVGFGNFSLADIHLKNLARVCNAPLGIALVAAVEQYIQAHQPIKA